MTRAAAILLPVLLLAGCAALAPRVTSVADDDAPAAVALTAAADDDEGHSLGRRLLFYIPNRIFDVLDVVRARLRVGPGFAVGVRATQLAGAQVGFYTALWVGVPGPRLEPEINWPFGAEAVAKAGATVVGVDVAPGTEGVAYGYGEIGAGFHLAFLGLDVGVDVWEVVDLVAGLLTFDVVGDDF